MSMRIESHPILPIEDAEWISFRWHGDSLTARTGETIAAALLAHGIRIFGHHPKDGSPQGLFCANGQCAQCLVLANGQPVKSCMTPVTEGMHVEPIEELPALPDTTHPPVMRAIETRSVPVLILGGGPAGMSAAVELARNGILSLLVDDKEQLGGKLVLQTHRFFGSAQAVHAGTRGIDIATKLADEVGQSDAIEVWTTSTALAVYSDGKVGILRHGRDYVQVIPEVLLVATGAREKSLLFKGNALPGVFGAGAFQTLVNRDRIRTANRLFIIGGGNVGLIAGYHALQAGIDVVGLVEALPECGGYKVHRDKLVRMGVPIYTSHTVGSANGKDGVESITIAKVDDRFQAIQGTERSFACDTILIAVGLDPVDEFLDKGKRFGIPTFAAGDAEQVAEASAAIFSGKIRGREIASTMFRRSAPPPSTWAETAEILKSHPGKTGCECIPCEEVGVFPVIHCSQEIPCNPCTTVCPQHLIRIAGNDIRRVPVFAGNSPDVSCVACGQCVAACPGLAITLVDYRQNSTNPTVTIPYEFSASSISVGDEVTVLDTIGKELGVAHVDNILSRTINDRTLLVSFRVPAALAKRVAGIRVQNASVTTPLPSPTERMENDMIVCRCERVTAGEIRELIRNGIRDINAIKAMTRAGMGACGGKTCTALIHRLFRDEGIDMDDVTEGTNRPLFIEVPLGMFAGVGEGFDEP